VIKIYIYIYIYIFNNSSKEAPGKAQRFIAVLRLPAVVLGSSRRFSCQCGRLGLILCHNKYLVRSLENPKIGMSSS